MRRQEMVTEDDGTKGKIVAFLESLHEDQVCALEIWESCLGETKRMTNKDSRSINAILDSLPGWKKINGARDFGEYGSQRGFKRTDKK